MRGPRFDPPKRQLYMTCLLFFFVCLVFCKHLAQPKPESDPISHDWTIYWFPYEKSICLGLLTPLAPVEFADPRSDCWPAALLVSARWSHLMREGHFGEGGGGLKILSGPDTNRNPLCQCTASQSQHFCPISCAPAQGIWSTLMREPRVSA